MSANTFKIEGLLLRELHRLKPKKFSMAAFVRDLLAQAVGRQKMLCAAKSYTDYLAQNALAKNEMMEWEGADLVKAPKRRGSPK